MKHQNKIIDWYQDFSESEPYQHPVINKQLTARESDVVQLLAQGYSKKQAGASLRGPTGRPLSAHTVADYLKTIYSKLDIRGRINLTRAAVSLDLLSLPQGKDLDALITVYEQLPPSERRAFHTAAQGLGHRASGIKNSISSDTASEYRQDVYRKLGVSNIAELTRVWLALRIEADRIFAEKEASARAAFDDMANFLSNGNGNNFMISPPHHEILEPRAASHGSHVQPPSNVQPASTNSFVDKYTERPATTWVRE